MGEHKLILKPGINSQYTKTLNEGGFSSSQLMRFHDQVPEKIGGWQSLVRFTGIPRALHAWADLNGYNYLASGSASALQIFSAGQIQDITPNRLVVNLPNPFSVTSGSPIVTATVPSHGSQIGDVINIPIYTSINNQILFGQYTITSVLDTNRFTFNAPINFTSNVSAGGSVPTFSSPVAFTTQYVTVTLNNHGFSIGNPFIVQVATIIGTSPTATLMGSYPIQAIIDANNFTIYATPYFSPGGFYPENTGNVRIEFSLQAGLVSSSILSGWGTGPYGLGYWGIGTSSTGVVISLRQWSLDNYGQNLLASPTNGAIYQWIPPSSFPITAAVILTNAPIYNTTIFVAMPQQQVVSLGAEILGVQDPLLVRYCDAGNNTIWTASTSNQAGSFRLSTGSKIIGGMQAGQQGLIWTDIGLWIMQYVGLPFVYSFNDLAKGCGLIAMRAARQLNQKVFWMSQKRFCVFDGASVSNIYCPVWDFIFKNLNMAQADKITAAANSDFNEITWYFPSLSGNGEVDSYVTYNPDNGTWVTGNLIRTAWIDQSVLGPPIGTDQNGWALQHEIGYDSVIDGVTTPISATIETAFINIQEGSDYMVMDQLLPDFNLTSSTVVKIHVLMRDYSSGPITTFGPYPLTAATKVISNIRARGREMALRFSTNSSNGFMRLGAIRYRNAPDGSL